VDEAARTGSEAVETEADRQRSPEEIRADIERTRETKQRVTGKKDEVVGKAKEASPDSASQFAGQAATTAKQNPLPLAAAGAFVAGFLIGRRSRRR
jgi:hypothetical protein